MSHSGADDLWHFKTTHLDWFRLLAGKGHTLKVSFLTFYVFPPTLIYSSSILKHCGGSSSTLYFGNHH